MTEFVNTAPKLEHFLSNDQYERFQTLILQRTGMLFGVKRRNALGRGITMMCKETAQSDLDWYFQMLQTTETDSPLWDGLIEELTVGETYFFRDENQIQALRRHLLPQIIAAHKHDRRIRIWSAGCASGEEAFTLSILLAELISEVEQWNICILGTDINKKVLKKGKAARYRPWSFRQTNQVFRSRYFKQKGEEYEVIPRIRKTVHFEYINLSEPVYPSLFTNTNAMDLILCRNVAIYYSEDVVREVVGRFYQCLVPGGWLMMGAAETSIPVFDQYAYHVFSGGTVYGKLNEPVTKTKPFYYRPPVEEVIPPPAPEPVYSPESYVFSNSAIETPPAIEDVPTPTAETHTESPEPPGEPDFLEQGIDLVRRKRYEEAKDVFLRCIAENPEDAEGFYQLGRVHANIGQIEAARSFCEQAIEINPLKAEVYYTLGLIHQESGDNKGAMERLKRSLFLEPDFAVAHVSMAILYGQLNQKEKSERHRRQAIDLAAALAPEKILPGTDDLTARTLLTMAKTLK